MHKNWMTKNKWSEESVRVVNEFLEFAFNNGAVNGMIRCPCTRCANGTSWVQGMVHAHLINYGICQMLHLLVCFWGTIWGYFLSAY
jgi:hypothetical protein